MIVVKLFLVLLAVAFSAALSHEDAWNNFMVNTFFKKCTDSYSKCTTHSIFKKGSSSNGLFHRGILIHTFFFNIIIKRSLNLIYAIFQCQKEEMVQRKANFYSAHDVIEEHNRKNGSTYKLDHNKFSLMVSYENNNMVSVVC